MNNSKVKTWAEKYFEEKKSEEIKMQEMMQSADYVKWLDGFTMKYSRFSDNDWLYFPEKISKEDLEKVNNLKLLYHGIERYASKNYIYPVECVYGNFYKIRLENTGFEIGMLVGQETLFFCNRVQIENQEDFIDFNDILNNKEDISATTIGNKLNELSSLIVSLYKNGVPIEALEITIVNTLNELNSQNDLEQVKVLKKS